MKNFIVSNFQKQNASGVRNLFHQWLQHQQEAHLPVPNLERETEWCIAGSFPREGHPLNSFFKDETSGSWILSLGTWFHSEGFCTGNEGMLLKRYLEAGNNVLAKELDGFFTLVIGDAGSEEIIILTDIIGSCHGYYRTIGDSVFISSSSFSLAGLDDVHLNAPSLQEYINTGVIYEDRTLFSEIKKLGPASIFVFSNGKLQSQHQYWAISDITPESLSGDQAVDQLFENLVHAAKTIGKKFPNPVCDLTGGYDSRALTVAFLELGMNFSTVVTGDKNHPDVKVSEELANAANLPHFHIQSFESDSFESLKGSLLLTDGEYDIIDYSRILNTHEILAEKFDISLNGSFAEVGRGYWWEILFPEAGKSDELDARKLAKLRYAAHIYDDSIFADTSKINLINHFQKIIQLTNSELKDSPNTMQMDNAYLSMRMQRWQGRIASSTNRIWPCLSPFMFRSVLETMLSTRTNDRRRGLLIRRMITRHHKIFAEIPLEHGHPPQPVNFSNFYRFWPVPVYYGKKILEKINNKIPVNSKKPEKQTPELPMRVKIWQNGDLADILKFSEVKNISIFDPDKLSRFIQNSQQLRFVYDNQWRRLFTLEFLLNTLNGV